jgi:hypothetical protein
MLRGLDSSGGKAEYTGASVLPYVFMVWCISIKHGENFSCTINNVLSSLDLGNHTHTKLTILLFYIH